MKVIEFFIYMPSDMRIFFIIVLNIFTADILCYAKLRIPPLTESDKPKVFLLSGFRGQPEVAFAKMEFPGYEKVYIGYSNFGFRLVPAAHQLEQLVAQHPGSMVVATSLGAKVVALTNVAGRAILINPCISPKHMHKRFQYWFTAHEWALSFVAVILGWLAFIPIIRVESAKKNGVKSVWYSLALLADQTRAISSNWTELFVFFTPRAIILGSDDWLLDNQKIRAAFTRAETVEISAAHADTLKHPMAYQSAIDALLLHPKAPSPR